MVNYFIVDLSALSVDNPNELLSELVDFYKQEVGSMGSTVVREIYVKPEQQKAGLVGPFWAFQTTSRRGFIDVRSQVLIALHGSSRTSGHIITVSTSARAFDQYQSFSRHIFQQFHATNRPVAGSEGKAGRGVQGGAGGLTRADFESSSV